MHDDIYPLLKKSQLFKSFDEQALHEISKLFNPEHFPENAIIVNQGEYGDKFFFVARGTLEVYVINKQGEEKIINVLQESDGFGELALLVDSVRSASVRARSTCVLYSINKNEFENFLNLHPKASRELLNIVSERLAQVLNVLSESGKKIFIQMNYHKASQECVERFEEYFKKISSFKVINVHINEFDALLSKYENQHENYYFLIRNDVATEKVLNRKADYIINFVEKNSGDFFLLPGCTQWQIENTARRIAKKTIGIALASGGAPAMSHIGILNEFKRENIPIDFIAGTSAGAVYGAVFAFNYPFDSLLDIMLREIKRPKLITILTNFCFNLSGLMRNTHLRKIFYPVFGESSIEDSFIPLATVASDLYTGKTVVIKRGKVVDGLIASNAAPLILEPLSVNDYLLIDGVATAPLPVKVLDDEKIDIRVAVPIPQLDLVVSMRKRPKMPAIYLRSRSMMAHEITNFSAKMADVIIEPKVEGARLHDWKNMQKYIGAGEEAAKTAIRCIQQYLKGHTSK